MNNTAELKSCPFCGEKAFSFYDEINDNFKIKTPNHDNMCPLKGHTIMGAYRSRMDLKIAWNTRTSTQKERGLK